MAKCKGFQNFKKRGEWVELQFMAQALRKGFNVSKPWGDSSSHDVGIEHGRHLLRVQVKSSSYRLGNGYLCAFKPNRRGGRYSVKKVDYFAGVTCPEANAEGSSPKTPGTSSPPPWSSKPKATTSCSAQSAPPDATPSTTNTTAKPGPYSAQQ
jgi:hypothetical protein